MKFLTETCSMLVRQDGIHDAVWECFFFVWLDLDVYMQIWGLELRSCTILSYDVNSFCGAQGTERMDR